MKQASHCQGPCGLVLRLLSNEELVRRYTYAGNLLAKARAKARNGKGFTQADIGAIIGLSVSAISKMEEPPQAPSAHAPKDPWPHVPNGTKMQQYAAVVGIDFCDLFPRDRQSPMAQLQAVLVRFDPAFVSSVAVFLATIDPRTLQAAFCEASRATQQ